MISGFAPLTRPAAHPTRRVPAAEYPPPRKVSAQARLAGTSLPALRLPAARANRPSPDQEPTKPRPSAADTHGHAHARASMDTRQAYPPRPRMDTRPRPRIDGQADTRTRAKPTRRPRPRYPPPSDSHPTRCVILAANHSRAKAYQNLPHHRPAKIYPAHTLKKQCHFHGLKNPAILAAYQSRYQIAMLQNPTAKNSRAFLCGQSLRSRLRRVARYEMRAFLSVDFGHCVLMVLVAAVVADFLAVQMAAFWRVRSGDFCGRCHGGFGGFCAP